MVVDIKPADSADFPVIMEIFTEAAAWLEEKGIDQWASPPNEFFRQRVAEAIERGEFYTVGIVTNRFGVLRFIWSDPYWPDDGLAGYVHSLAVRPSMHGQKLGEMMLSWAMIRAKREKKQFLRLDCRADNGRIRRYYEEQGFVYKGEVTDRDYTAALYEKPILRSL